MGIEQSSSNNLCLCLQRVYRTRELWGEKVTSLQLSRQQQAEGTSGPPAATLEGRSLSLSPPSAKVTFQQGNLGIDLEGAGEPFAPSPGALERSLTCCYNSRRGHGH